jgi:Holliday junction resolvasome RuvABC endonuclease subunit
VTAVESAVTAPQQVGVGATTGPKVIGLDLSLSGTGIAGNGWADTITFPARKKRDDRTDYAHRRLHHIRTSLFDYLDHTDFAVLEGLSYDSYDTNRQNAGLSWIVRHDLWRRRIPYALVPPSNLKQYATGSGGADKGQVTSAVRAWFPGFDGDDNAADATVLYVMGRDWLGIPAVTMPDMQRAAMAGCDWPELAPAGGAA